MADVEPIRTETDYEAALARIDELMDAEPGSPEGGELDVLVDLVDLYERRHEPMGHPDPVAAIEFRMEQAGLSPRDLVPFLGSRAKVSEILSGKRARRNERWSTNTWPSSLSMWRPTCASSCSRQKT